MCVWNQDGIAGVVEATCVIHTYVIHASPATPTLASTAHRCVHRSPLHHSLHNVNEPGVNGHLVALAAFHLLRPQLKVLVQTLGCGGSMFTLAVSILQRPHMYTAAHAAVYTQQLPRHTHQQWFEQTPTAH